MDWNRVEGNWKQMKGKVKEQWGKLTDDDLDVINGKQDQLEGRLNSVTATPRTKPRRKSTTGTVAKSGDHPRPYEKAPKSPGLFCLSRSASGPQQGDPPGTDRTKLHTHAVP